VTNKRRERIIFVKCDLCGSDDTIDYMIFNDYKYVQCKNCGLVYQNPRPLFQSLRKRYGKKYFNYELRNQENFFSLMKKTLSDIKFLKKFSKQFTNGKRFLDIGCATGMLLNYVKQYGWNVMGIELDKYSAEYARKKYLLNIINKRLEKAHIEKNSVNVVHWSHVIEHLTSPTQGLKKIHKILKKNGYMLLTTPRLDSFQQKLFKKDWRSYHRDHLTVFSKKTLKKIVEKSGFKVIKFFSWGGIAVDKGYPKWVKFIVDRLVKLFNKGDVMFLLAKKI